jgi:hypothetical protein
MADMLDQFGDMEFAGVHFEMAIYGAGLMPDYMVVLLDGDVPLGDPESFMTSFATGFASSGGGTLDMDRAVNEQVGDTEYLCAPTTGAPTTGFAQELSVCVFVGSGSSAVVMGFDASNLQSLLGTTKELHEALA